MRIPVAGWVAPFGDPGINDRSHLPRAFRSVPRPSSPLSAKASTRCPCFARSKTIGAAVASHPNTPDNRRAQGQAPFWQGPQFGRAPLDKGFPCQGFPAGAASSMKTLLGRPACELTPAPRRRPPRSHSQIRFTRSINTAPDTRSPARDRSRPVDPTPEQTWSSPNVVHQRSDVRNQNRPGAGRAAVVPITDTDA